MSDKKRARGFGKKRQPLREEIEVLNDREDRTDDDVIPYVDNLMERMRSLQPMEEISLLTQEDAKQALTMIDETLKQLNERMGIARSLRQLLETKRAR